jgi:hypothetical protein
MTTFGPSAVRFASTRTAPRVPRAPRAILFVVAFSAFAFAIRALALVVARIVVVRSSLVPRPSSALVAARRRVSHRARVAASRALGFLDAR